MPVGGSLLGNRSERRSLRPCFATPCLALLTALVLAPASASADLVPNVASTVQATTAPVTTAVAQTTSCLLYTSDAADE